MVSETRARSQGIVVDDPLARALLYVGIREGLLDGDPSVGDGFVPRILSAPPDPAFVRSAFEYLVLGGKVLIPFGLPAGWGGWLLECGMVAAADSRHPEGLISGVGLSPSLVLAMLQDRGISWTEAQLGCLYGDYLAAVRAWRALPWTWSAEVTPATRAAFREVEDGFERLRPVFDCDRDFHRVVTCALRSGSLSALPVTDRTLPVLETPWETASARRISLLRIAGARLRRVPVADTLRETIALAMSSGGDALRVELTRWTDAVRRNDGGASVAALGEVDRATAELGEVEGTSATGEYSTVIGVPEDAVAEYLSGPLTSLPGAVVSVIGGVAMAGHRYDDAMNRWAMYCQTRRAG